jgi:alkanesulfonate monooxygenase SsuD/methylene tetrahydromethanopterin reductase-like flavin-dependent oxidoreductase (luciferase family)
MKFGIFYELQLPRPWQDGDELKLYQDALTQLETADRLGYDYAWVVEHHFLEEYSHSPSPESFLAAASQRTKNIRLGHGIFQLTTNHPARVAERVAVLDLLSRGRVEFGMGESASITELTPFGRDMETKREVFEEAVQAIFPMFTKIDVNGVNEHPLYQYLKSEKSGLLGSSIKWNFTKFLVNRSGQVVARHAPTTTPQSLKKEIEALL